MPRRTSVYQPLQGRERSEQAEPRVPRVRLTTRVTLAAYDVITELQRRHRRKTGKALRLWEVLDAAIIDYAKRQGLEAEK